MEYIPQICRSFDRVLSGAVAAIIISSFNYCFTESREFIQKRLYNARSYAG